MSIGDFFTIKGRIWRDQLNTILKYYRKPGFACVDLAFGFFSFFSNPYRTCRKFLQKRGDKEIYTYGETPFSTLEKIAKACDLKPQDRWLELGSGRGKGCFWIADFIGCEAIGVEWIPQFVRLGNFLKTCLRKNKVSFHIQNMEEADFSGISAVYLYGTCLESDSIDRILKKMETLPSGAKVVSISEPLVSKKFSLQKSFDVQYPWGKTQAYLHIKN